MRINIPEKNAVVNFPDDMPPEQIEKQIRINFYDQDIGEAYLLPEEELPPQQFATDPEAYGIPKEESEVLQSQPGSLEGQQEDKSDYDYAGYVEKYGEPDQSKGQHLTDEFKLPNHITFSKESKYSTPDEPGGEWKEVNGKWNYTPSKFVLSQHPAEELKRYFAEREPDAILNLPAEQESELTEAGQMSSEMLERAKAMKPDQPPEKTILSYAPYMAVKAVKGAMGPLLSPLKTLGMDTEGVLNTAAEYWQKRLPDVGIPNAGIVFDEKGELDIERIDDMPLSEIVGATSEGAGFLGPASVALKGAGLITEKLAQYARPFYRSILKGMIGGALLGEGKKDETLESMAMFGLFEGAGFAIGEIPGAIKGIKNSNSYRTATIKERGLVVQDLEQTIKQNPGISEADLVKTSDAYFAEAVAKRRPGVEPKQGIPAERIIPAEIKVAPAPEIVKPAESKPVKDMRTGGMTPEIIKSIPDPVVRAFAEGRMSIEKPKEAPDAKVKKPKTKEEPETITTEKAEAEEVLKGKVEPWGMTSEEYAADALSKNKYADSYKNDPELLEGLRQNSTQVWKEIVEKRAETHPLSDSVLDDYAKIYGEDVLKRVFRGKRETGIKQWEPKDVRIYDKSYKQVLAGHSELTLKGDKKEYHRQAVKKAIQQGKIESHPDYPELTKEEPKLVKGEGLTKIWAVYSKPGEYEIFTGNNRPKTIAGQKAEELGSVANKEEWEKVTEYGGKPYLAIGRISLQEFRNRLKPKKKPEVFPSLTGAIPQSSTRPKKPIITEAQKKAKAKKKAVKETQLKIETAEDAKKAVHSMVRQRRYNLNLSSYETNKFINDIEQVTTKRQQDVIPFIIEKTSVPKKFNRPDLEKAHAENKELLVDISKQVSTHFDKGWKKYKKSINDMSAEEVENYVTHIWEIPRSKKQEVTNWFTTKNRFAKQRFIETLEKGINELGLKPKTTNILEIIRIHDAATNKAIENKKLVDGLIKLKKDGVPLIERIDKAPPDWVIINHPALQKAVFIPGESKMGEKITPELENILYEMGVAIGRRINPKVWGKPSRVAGLYKTGDPPEVRFQRFMSNKTIAHEIGHHLDVTLDLGERFLNQHKTELYALNKKRIEESGLEPEYTTKTSEQIAEAFAFLFTDPKLMTKLAPTVMTDMLARLKQDGVLSKLIDFDFEKKAKNLIEEQLNTLTKLPVRVHPDLVRPLKVVFESVDSSEIMQAYDSIAGILKKTSLSLSLFHHLALGETGIATIGPGKVAGIYFNPAKIYKALVRGEFDVFKKEAIAKDAIGHGLQMGATSDIPVQKIQGYLNDFAAKTKNIAIVNKATELLRTFNEKWDIALWDYLHDTLKLYAYESLVAQHIDPAKNVKAQKEEVAQFVNDTFGGQNWDVLMITPKEVQIMTRALLSADWTVSTMRQALSPTGVGTIHKEINKPLRKKMGRMFWLKAGLYFGVGINMLNVTFRRADRKENPKYYKDRGKDILDDSMYGNTLGHKSHLFVGRYEDGTERYIRWGKQFRELMEMFIDDTGFSPVSAAVKKIGGKANPVLQLTAQITTGHSLSGFKNDDISGKKGWDFTFGVFKTLLKSPLPFSSRTLMTPNKEFHITDIAMPSSKGMSRYKAMALFKIAIIKKDERLIKEIYQDTLENNLPAYTLFTAALTSLKAEESREYSKTIKDLESLKKHKPVKTPREAMILKRKINRLVKEEKEKLVGIRMLDVALTKAKLYQIEKELEND